VDDVFVFGYGFYMHAHECRLIEMHIYANPNKIYTNIFMTPTK